MTRKISVITLHTVSNYGSCLQAYATQSLFEKLGLQVEFVDYYRKNNLPENAVERVFRGQRLSKYQSLWERMPWLKSLVSFPLSRVIAHQRKPFDAFRVQFLHLSRRYEDSKELELDPPAADIYCTGSDQVWNSVWNEGFESPYFLEFAPTSKPRIAFSASIGREKLDSWEIEPIRNALRKYQHIAMRELSGVQLLKDLGFDGTQLVLDPTLMLDKREWQSIASIPKRVPKEYMIVYQLNKNRNFSDYALRISEAAGIPLVKICYGAYDVMPGAKNIITPRVTDFVGLILNAKYVITDSFHATAFALNLNIPFISIPPDRFSTRISSILNLTNTEDRLVTDFHSLCPLRGAIDFSEVNAILDHWRETSMQFLVQAVAE